jgi:hypothetical protein
VGAASAGHLFVDVMNLLPMEMGNADASDYSVSYLSTLTFSSVSNALSQI